MISNEEKKKFIWHFLNKYQAKKRESVWILKYIANDEICLKNIHFVDNASYSPRALIISTNCSDEIPLRFYSNGIMTTNAERAYNDIKLNRNDDLYIELQFKKRKDDHNYYSILEENPYLPITLRENKEYKEVVDSFLDYCLVMANKNKLLEEINKALDEGKKDEFEKLSLEYKELRIPHLNNFEIVNKKRSH